MNGRALGVIAIAGLAVVGFAIFYLGSGREPRTRRPDAKETKVVAKPPAPPEVRFRPPPPERREAEPAEDDEEERPQPTIAEAREAFDSYIAELDRELARLDKSGGRLTQEAWTEYRVRAAGAVDDVLRVLDHTDPNMMIEIKDKQDAVKERLQKLEPPKGG